MVNEPTAVDTADLKAYEIGYLLTPLVAEDKATEAIERLIKAPLAAQGGQIKNEMSPRMITLAYPIKKVVEHKGNVFRQAYFGAIQFNLTPEAVVALVASLKKSPEMVRFLLLSRPKSSTKPEVKRFDRTERSAALPAKTAEKDSLTQEAIDKEIEDLLAPTK